MPMLTGPLEGLRPGGVADAEVEASVLRLGGDGREQPGGQGERQAEACGASPHVSRAPPGQVATRRC